MASSATIRIGAGWAKKTPSLWAEPKKTFQPYGWSYAQAKGALDAAGRLINTELAERRNLVMHNPAGATPPRAPSSRPIR